MLLSPFIKGGTVSTVPYNHYSTLATIEDLFGLPKLGQATTVSATFGRDVFNRIRLTGRVQAAASHTGCDRDSRPATTATGTSSDQGEDETDRLAQVEDAEGADHGAAEHGQGREPAPADAGVGPTGQTAVECRTDRWSGSARWWSDRAPPACGPCRSACPWPDPAVR